VFNDAHFGDEAQFQSTEFKQLADFSSATFKGDGSFQMSEFQADVEFVEAECDGMSFSGIDLSRANFEGASLTGADLSRSEGRHINFQGAHLESADFEGADLSNANLERAKLSNADLFGADLSGAHLYGTRVGDAAINTETVFDKHDEYRCVYDPNSEYEYDPDGEEKVGKLRKAMGAYHVLEQLTRANTLPDEQAKFFVRRQDMRRTQLRQDGRQIDYWSAEAQNAVFRHGESFSRVVAWSVGTIVAFTLVFPLGGWLQSESTGTITYDTIAESPLLLWKTFHHSTLLFLTGDGPLDTIGIVGEILTTIEALIAPILLALLVFVLGRRAAR
jgi:uncharacterized protein YjbI with pentapeptide repeats